MQMKLLIIAVLFPIVSIFSQDNYIDNLQKERTEFEKELFQTNSILNKSEQKVIESLNYFPIDSSWILKAEFKKDKGKVFEMPTTTARTQKYQRVGYLHFNHNNEKFHLTVYKSIGLTGEEFKNYVFIPFKDGNAPDLTYGGGRYLDMDLSLDQKTVEVDFNTAYNPYCVYSYRYSCPITPEENHVKVKINAGAMNPDKKE